MTSCTVPEVLFSCPCWNCTVASRHRGAVSHDTEGHRRVRVLAQLADGLGGWSMMDQARGPVCIGETRAVRVSRKIKSQCRGKLRITPFSGFGQLKPIGVVSPCDPVLPDETEGSRRSPRKQGKSGHPHKCRLV